MSIPDQRRQALAYCAANGWDVAIEFVEPGASGTDDRRPELQRLLDMGTAGGAPAKGMDKNDIERFARDHFADAGLAQAAHMHLQRVPPPRVVTGPILLTGIATCAGCGGGMTLRTGKTGRCRYYTRSTCARQGKSACKGRSIPMDKLDRLVTDRLADRLLKHERVGDLLAGLMERQAAKNEDQTTRLTALRAKISDAESRLRRLYEAIESGVADLNDQMLKDRVGTVKTERDLAQIAFDRAVTETNPRARITDEKIATFVERMRSNILTGDTPFRRAYIRSVIDQVEVDDDEIRIWGRKGVLERLVAASGGSGPEGVPSFVRKWRARQDSNL